MVDLLQNEDKLLDGTVLTFKWDQLKRKGNMQSAVWKYAVKRIWKLQCELKCQNKLV